MRRQPEAFVAVPNPLSRAQDLGAERNRFGARDREVQGARVREAASADGSGVRRLIGWWRARISLAWSAGAELGRLPEVLDHGQVQALRTKRAVSTPGGRRAGWREHRNG